MQAIALTGFVVFMALAPTLSNKYDLWVQETATPYFFRTHPYLLGVVFSIAIFCSFVFLIYATIREHRIQKGKKSLQERLEERLEKLERKVG